MRVWLKRLLLVVAGIVAFGALSLGALNLALNSPPAHWLVNRRSQRIVVSWRHAWCAWPGDLHVSGLVVEGHTGTTGWRIAAERVRARLELPALLHRRFVVAELQGEGASGGTWRESGQRPGGQRPAAVPPRHPWSFTFERISLGSVHEVDLYGLRIVGGGTAAGAFSRVGGGDFALPQGRLKMASAQALLDEEPVASDLHLEADLAIAPYSPREHPGVAGFDFVTGSLRLAGSLPPWPVLSRLQGGDQPTTTPGELSADLRLAAGALAIGSQISLRSLRPAAPDGAPASAQLSVEATPGLPRLTVALQVPDFALAGRDGRAPLLTARGLAVRATTEERRLSRLFADTGALGGGTAPLVADSSAGDVTLAVAGPHAVWELRFDRVAGQLDAAALLRREVRISALRGAGVSSQIRFREAPAAPSPAGGGRWAVHLADAEFTDVRTVTLGPTTASGSGRATGSLDLGADGVLAVPAATLDLPRSRLAVASKEASPSIDLRLAGSLAPFAPGELAGARGLAYFSGTAAVRGRVDTLGFLAGFFAKTPWLGLAGSGDLDAELRIDAGRLLPGTRLSVTGARVEATILDDLASGTARVSGAVEASDGGPRSSLLVAFDRYSLAPLNAPHRPYVRGSGLKLSAAGGTVNLAAPEIDLRAGVDVEGAEVPDLAVYNAYLPEGSGVRIDGGQGKLRLHLRLDGASETGDGDLALSSGDLRMRFEELSVAGRLALRTRLASSDLRARRFTLDDARLDLDGVSYREPDEEPAEATDGWWAHLALSDAKMVWSRPLTLDAGATVHMRDAGLLLSLFAQKRHYLKWFASVLDLEDLTARGRLALDGSQIRLDPLDAEAGKFALRSRLRFAKPNVRGDLLLRYGVFKVGLELRDGERDWKLLRPEHWFDSRQDFD
jgi:hypothetical protein